MVPRRSRTSADDGTSENWDAALRPFDPDILQSWRWGEFKRLHGWQVERISIAGLRGVAYGQVLFRSLGLATFAYLPRGPVVAGGEAVVAEFVAALDAACRRRRSILAVVEPRVALPSRWTSGKSSFVTGPEPFQTASTVKVPLAGDAELVAGMRRDTRSNLHQARRRGVVVERAVPTPEAVDTFYRLLRETGQRGGFGIHRRAYYDDFLRVFGENALLAFTRFDGEVTAGLIAAYFGNEGRSMYAGSSSSHRGRGDTALLRMEAMVWAREMGCGRYDLGGITTGLRATAGEGDAVGGRSTTDLAGVRNFKMGFGGDIVTYPSTIERRYRPAAAWLLRRLYPRYRSVVERPDGPRLAVAAGLPAGLETLLGLL